MGTTLTGTTPQDTYDSLIKVTDNGPISGTAKYLSDGLGNDSALALSTTAVGIGTASPSEQLNLMGANVYTSKIRFSYGASNTDYYANLGYNSDGNKVYLRIADGGSAANIMTWNYDGKVGIGTSAPISKLNIDGGTGDTTANDTILSLTRTSSTSNVLSGKIVLTAPSTYQQNINFRLKTTASSAEDPSYYTDIMRVTANGLCFGSDTAAANALDDYEEGTWTMGIEFGGASVGVTYDINTGTYTKIGRQVTVNGVLVLTNKGSSTGGVLLTGLPFTISSANPFYAAATLRMENVTFANQFQAYGGIGSTVVAIDEITEAGVNGSLTHADFANNSTIMINLTYFV